MSRVVAVIVTWNKKDLLLLNLRRLVYKVRCPSGVQLDILVVDNDSSDGTREAVADAFPDVQVVNTGANLGGAGGFNVGLKVAVEHGYDYVWAMDNDALSSRGILEKYWSAIQLYKDRAMLGGTMNVLEEPRLINESGAYLDQYARIILRMHRADIAAALMTQPPYREVDYVAFANVFFPCRLIEEIGFFPDFFIHYDDVDFCRRAKGAGFHIINVLDAVYWHESYQAKPAILLRHYDIRNQLYVLQQFNPRKVRRSILNYLIDSAADLFRGRYLLAELTLTGIEDCRRGLLGRRDVDKRDLVTHSVSELVIEELMATHGAKSCVLHYTTYARLFRPYRALWHRFMQTAECDFHFLVRAKEGRFYLSKIDRSALSRDELIPIPEQNMGDDVVRRNQKESVLFTDDVTLNLGENLCLRRFRKRLWVWGGSVIDYGQRGPWDMVRSLWRTAVNGLCLLRPLRSVIEK